MRLLPTSGNDRLSPLSRGLLTAFTLPTLVLGVMHGPEGQVQAIYAKHAGIALTSLALAVLLTRIFDAVTYPLIGTWSDRSQAQAGTRRNWVIGGAILSVFGVWFLLRPPAHVGVVYFGVWTAVTYLGWKIIEIPLQAWSYSLSTDYAQRARVQAWRALALMAGQMLFFTTPFIAVRLGYSDSTELDFRSLGLAAVLCGLALPLATLIFVLRVPSGTSAWMSASAPKPERLELRKMLAAVRSNPPLLRLLAAFLPANVLAGLNNGVAYLYMDSYLGLSRQYPAIMITALLSTLPAIPLWTALSARFERHRIWAASLILGGLALAALAVTSPGTSAAPISFVLYPILVFCLAGSLIVFTMSADIVDYGRLYTGDDHGGLYGALFAFLQKSLLGVSTAAGVALVGAFGFDATAASQSAQGILGIKLAFAIIPATGLFGAAAIIWNYPLDRARIARIQAELHRAAVATPVLPASRTPSRKPGSFHF